MGNHSLGWTLRIITLQTPARNQCSIILIFLSTTMVAEQNILKTVITVALGCHQ